MPWKRLLASEFSSTLREEWFSSHELPASILISNQRYKHPGSKQKSLFYIFNNLLDYVLAHYFAKSKTIKGNVNKFPTNLLMTSLIKKLLYKNADK